VSNLNIKRSGKHRTALSKFVQLAALENTKFRKLALFTPFVQPKNFIRWVHRYSQSQNMTTVYIRIVLVIWRKQEIANLGKAEVWNPGAGGLNTQKVGLPILWHSQICPLSRIKKKKRKGTNKLINHLGPNSVLGYGAVVDCV